MTSPAKFTDMGANSSYPDKTGQSGSRFSTLYRGLSFHFSEGDVATREKKKKLSKLQTLRKKLTRVRRHSRSFDYAKAIRDYTSNWTIRELSDLVDEYEASLNLKEITLLANLARPTANSLKQDLSHLYHSKFGSDLELIYRGTSFPVHRAILSSRCPYFRDLLQKYPKYGAQVPVEIKSHGVDTSLFSALLHYLYTGEFLLQDSQYEDLDTCILVHLRREFGTPNLLEYDLRNLLDSDDYCDAVLVFALDSDCHELLSGSCDTYGACAFSSSSKLELSCHKAILAARSNFFRNLLVRRGMHSLGKECSERANQKCERIVLDETVIPRKYARVLLQAIYLDTVDLSCVIRNSVSTSSLSEVQAIVTGKGHLTHAEEAIEIHEIGQFLDLPILSQGSEDIIVDTLGMDNLVPILLWSSQPLGSAWVYRQALHYLREDFLQIAHSPTILDLPKKYLIDAISSDFLQASEADVLCAVLKWGEHQLVKRMEEREPNLLNHTTHSVSKKGIKKRDLSDVELRDILSDLLVYVRADHIIPPNHEVLTNAIKRGLISTPPSHMMGDEPGHQSRASAWIRGRNRGTFLKPRLFQPHYDETKALLDEQLSQIQGNEEVQLRTVHMSNIPDTLYMVEGDTLGLQYFPGHLPSAATVDIIGGTILVPHDDTLQTMLKREGELKQSQLVHRANSLPCADRRAITHQLQLRVVREFGLPDSSVQVFKTGQLFALTQAPEHFPRLSQPQLNPSLPMSLQSYHFPQSTASSSPAHYGLGPISPVMLYDMEEKEASSCSGSFLSDPMPDIAMASSAVSSMTIQEDLELDLGDGSHHGTLYL